MKAAPAILFLPLLLLSCGTGEGSSSGATLGQRKEELRAALSHYGEGKGFSYEGERIELRLSPAEGSEDPEALYRKETSIEWSGVLGEEETGQGRILHESEEGASLLSLEIEERYSGGTAYASVENDLPLEGGDPLSHSYRRKTEGIRTRVSFDMDSLLSEMEALGELAPWEEEGIPAIHVRFHEETALVGGIVPLALSYSLSFDEDGRLISSRLLYGSQGEEDVLLLERWEANPIAPPPAPSLGEEDLSFPLLEGEDRYLSESFLL